MSKRLLSVILLFVLFGGAIAYGSFRLGRPAPSPASGKPAVAATFYAIYDIARHVAGDEADVRLILPPGANPHTFEPSPATIKDLHGSKVAYAIGHDIDGWIEPLIDDEGIPSVTLDKGVVLRASAEDHEHEEEGHDVALVDYGEEEHPHDESGSDPHYWLTIVNAKRMAKTIADDLSARLPASAPAIARNLQAYSDELDAAEREIRLTLSGVKNRKIVTLHDAWYYFAEAYALEIVGTFEPTAGREPTPQYLAELSDAVKASESKTLYSEPLLSVAGIEPFARDNGLRIVTLDPAEGSDPSSYIQIMIKNAQTIRDNQ